MNTSKVCPVILSGGSGVRLWPLSRSNMPKQFLPLPDLDGGSLFGLTVERALNLNVALGRLIVVCNESQRFLASAALGEVPDLAKKCDEVRIVLEPLARNTAPAIALAAFAALEGVGDKDPDPLLLVLPSDHIIQPQAEFAAAVDKAAVCAAAGDLALFGITPQSPATGFGYIEQGEPLTAKNACDGYRVSRFVEKPDLESAEEMLAAGGYFWNSGMFLFGARVYLEELENHEPEIYTQTKLAWEGAQRKGEVVLPEAEAFAAAPKISIDYAVMERTARAALVPLDVQWSDLGSFQAFYENAARDEAGNASFGDVVMLDASGNYLSAQSRLLAVLGIRDLVVVETPDCVLVAPRERCQDIGGLVEDLKAKERNEPEAPAREPRPWGSFEVLLEGPNFKVKRIEVLPGASLSLQMHYKRSEHWVVVQGLARVQVGEQELTLHKDETVYIPTEARHRMSNPGKEPLVVIEVQNGLYLGEDDIVRLADEYNRLD